MEYENESSFLIDRNEGREELYMKVFRLTDELSRIAVNSTSSMTNMRPTSVTADTEFNKQGSIRQQTKQKNCNLRRSTLTEKTSPIRNPGKERHPGHQSQTARHVSAVRSRQKIQY